MPSQVEALRSALGTRDAAIVSVLAHSGIRPGECLALTWADITETRVRVSRAMSLGGVRGTKTGKSRSVRLIAPLAQDLREWRFGPG